MMKIKHVAGIAVITLSIGLITTYCLYTGLLWFNNPSLTQFPVRGVDVSHHQGDIDWEHMARENIHFAFVKATEGGDFKDPKFGSNWSGALKAGLAVGAYHFFLASKPGQEQANNFIKTVPLLPGTLPPVLDVECKVVEDEPTRRLIRQEIADCLSILEEHYKRKPIIYTTFEAYQAYIHGSFTDYPLWIRSVFTSPTFEDGRRWTFWQYSSRGRLAAFTGPEEFIDLNAFNGTAEEFTLFVHGTP